MSAGLYTSRAQKMCTMTLRRSKPIIPQPYSPKGSSGVPAVVSSSLLFDF